MCIYTARLYLCTVLFASCFVLGSLADQLTGRCYQTLSKPNIMILANRICEHPQLLLRIAVDGLKRDTPEWPAHQNHGGPLHCSSQAYHSNHATCELQTVLI